MGLRRITEMDGHPCWLHNPEKDARRFGLSPVVDIPMVQVLGKDDSVVLEGWYAMLPMRTLYAVGGNELKPDEMAHVVIRARSSDWGLPTVLEVFEVTPPHKIVLKA